MQQTYQQLVTDREELDVKINTLNDFFANRLFSTLPDDEQDRMFCQQDAMKLYSHILGQRISAFNQENKDGM